MPEHIHQAVAGADVVGPVCDVFNAVLLEQLYGVIGEPIVQGRQFPGHGVVDA
jgi:hypothetical protein